MHFLFFIYLCEKLIAMTYKALDIAKLLINKAADDGGGELLTNLKLQKLLYYEQGFHLAYFGTPLFEENIEAWQYGPVVPDVYNYFKEHGKNGITSKECDVQIDDKEEYALFEEVYNVYGKYSAFGLMHMTHSETPWASTNVGVGNVISLQKMADFFKTRLER